MSKIQVGSVTPTHELPDAGRHQVPERAVEVVDPAADRRRGQRIGRMARLRNVGAHDRSAVTPLARIGIARVCLRAPR